MAVSPPEAPADLTIEIGPHPFTEEAIVDHPVAHVEGGGTLDWHCDYGPWVVLFEPRDSGPFADGDRGRRPGDGKSRDLRDHSSRPGLHFKYTVAFYHEEQGKVYVADPEIIVDPTGGLTKR